MTSLGVCFVILSIATIGVTFGNLALHDEYSNTNNSSIKEVILSNYHTDNNNGDIILKHIHGISNEVKVKKSIIPIMFMIPYSENETCVDSDSDFPEIFTDEQRKKGAIIISFAIGIYCFTLLAIVCNSYFLPCVERICESLNLTPDVAAATFMAMATSAPELFVNIIGTFVTGSDVGIGAVIGSSMFNTLAVGALGGLTARTAIQLDWWPVTRDCTIYIITISLLIIMTWDGFIYWYESLVLFIAYFIYFGILFNNKRIKRFVKGWIKKYSSPSTTISTEELTKTEAIKHDTIIYYIEEPSKEVKEVKAVVLSEAGDCLKSEKDEENTNAVKINEENIQEVQEKKDKEYSKFFKMPEGGFAKKAFFIYTWPLKYILFCIIPSPKIKPKLYPITFILCMLLIGGNSYIVLWMSSNIGRTFGIPEAIQGLTFLAAGGCLPEAISVVIMSRRGEGSIGVSNALGANTMNILVSLGLPWFIKNIILGSSGKPFLEILSGSIEYTIVGLMIVTCCLFVTLYFNRFRLKKRTGIILGCIYLIFLMATVVAEILLLDVIPCE